jgi:hypothetical protein
MSVLRNWPMRAERTALDEQGQQHPARSFPVVCLAPAAVAAHRSPRAMAADVDIAGTV